MRYRHPLDKIVLLLATTLIFACFSSEANAATFVVNSTADAQDVAPADGICQTSTPGECTLRAAITEANALPGDDTINLSSGTFLITLMPAGEDNNAGGDFDIRSNITINGTGSTVIQAAGTGGVGVDRVFHFVTPGISASVNNVNIRNGRAPSGATGGAVLIEQDTVVLLDRVNVSNHQADSGGAISNHGALTLTGSTINNAFAFASSGNGGGVLNSGTLSISSSTIRNNEATRAGAGLYNSGMLTLADSTVSNNSAFASTSNTQGGGIYNTGTTSIATSTLSGNSAATEFGSPTDGQGGGIFNYAGTITISSSTLSGNGATGQAGAIYSSGPATLTSTTVTGAGAGIYNVSSLDLQNTIIAGGCPAGGGTVNAENSLIQDGLGCVNGTNTSNRSGNPLLGPLADNGGLTMTHALSPNSPAIDRGNSFGTATDQRGFARPVDDLSIPNTSDGSDIGSFEFVPTPPVTFTVNSTADVQDAAPGNGFCETSTPGICTLRAAITESNALAGHNVIVLPAGTYNIQRFAGDEDVNAVGDFDISSSLTINGAGAGSTFIQAAIGPGSATERVLHIYSGQLVVKINGVTIRHGNRAPGGSVYYGTGILNDGSIVMLNNSTVSYNSGIYGGGIATNANLTLNDSSVSGNLGEIGSGIFNNFGTVTLTRSTVSNNSATTTGGGIWSTGLLTVANSTVSGNSAVFGGGIYAGTGTTSSVTASTITNNTASGVFSRGGGISNEGVATISNSIIAGNHHPTSPDAYGSFVSNGYNLIGDRSGSSGFTSVGDQAGTSPSPIDPMLQPLQNNGGPTKTHRPDFDSPVIDTGNRFGLTTDQRGFASPADIPSIPNTADGSDIGAFETLPWLTLTVNSEEDIQDSVPGDGICSTASPGVCTLRAAITEANASPGDDIINLPAGTYQIELAADPENGNAAGDLDVNSSITINGAGANSTTVQGASGPGFAPERVFQFISGVSSVNNVTVRYGNATFGGGIFNGAILTVSNSILTNNLASLDGGGFYNNLGTATLSNSIVSNNSASRSGGGLVTSTGEMTLIDSIVANNSAQSNGGIYSLQSGGLVGMMNLTNSLVSQNSASSLAGGINNSATMTMINSTVSGNSANQVGGIYNPGTLTITSSTVTNNTAVEYGGIYGVVDVRPAFVRNSIIAGNNSALSPDVYGSYNSQGYNLVGASDGATGFTAAGDQVGTIAAPIDPLLSKLQNNGGPTMTHALLAGSPAIDKGNSFGLLTDQRGSPRPVDVGSIPNAADGSDIGAFEVQAPTAAGVTVGGRVLTSSGVGIARSRVMLTDQAGQTRTVQTNTFGYYRFDSVPAGGTFVLAVSAKGYSFTAQVIDVLDDISDMNFVAVEVGIKTH